jgi:hypothetical protein
LSAACAVHGPCDSAGLTDLEEDRDRDGLINENGTSTGESNPFDADTDDPLAWPAEVRHLAGSRSSLP